MANHKSAVKRNRQTIKRTLQNKAYRSRMRKAVREFKEAVNGESDKCQELFKKASSVISKVASKGVIHKATAARKISRLSKLMK